MKNRKIFFICIVFAFCVCGVFANDGENSKKKIRVGSWTKFE